MPGLLCLKWNNHTSAFDKLLNNILLKNLYSDGTLICYGKFYPIHRFVLSTCSEYFEEIFDQSLQMGIKHPFIIVKDVQPVQMEHLLNYMYRGEVNVCQEMLPDLIKAAEAFKIKGLAVPDDDTLVSDDGKHRNVSPYRLRKSRKLDDRPQRNKCSVDSEATVKPNSEFDSNHNGNSDSNTESYRSSSVAKRDNKKDLDKSMEVVSVDPLGCDIRPEEIVKVEQIDPSEAIEGELPDSLEPEYLCSEDSIKEEGESSYESLATTAESLLQFQEDGNQGLNNQFDAAQTSSWGDPALCLEGEGGGEAENGGQRIEHLDSRSTTGIIDCRHSESVSRGEVKKEGQWFSCSLCSYRSKIKGSMEKHYRSHTGEKPYLCPACPYRATQNSHIHVHFAAMHSGQKPFKCPLCSYSTARKDKLIYHIKKSHTQLNS